MKLHKSFALNNLLTASLLACAVMTVSPALASDLDKIRVVPDKIRIEPDVLVDIEIWTDRGEGARYCVGEPIEIYFRTNVDAYVAILDTDTTGHTHRLFPNRWDRDHFVEGGRVYRLPIDGYSFKIDGPAGRETLRAIAALNPRDLRRAAKRPGTYAPTADRSRRTHPRSHRVRDESGRKIHHGAEKIVITPDHAPRDVAFDSISHRVRDRYSCRARTPRPWWYR